MLFRRRGPDTILRVLPNSGQGPEGIRGKFIFCVFSCDHVEQIQEARVHLRGVQGLHILLRQYTWVSQ